MSQSQAARAMGIPQSQIGKLELGQRQLQFIEGLRLAELYGQSPDQLDPRGVDLQAHAKVDPHVSSH